MNFNVKTTFPKEEEMSQDEGKFTTTRRTELTSGLDLVDVIELYHSYQRADYDVSIAIRPPVDEDGDVASPFEIAAQLTEHGIDYKSTLKVKNSGNYDTAQELARIVESHGFDFNIDAKMKINDKSTVDFAKSNTWTSTDDVVFKVTPKAATKDINELKGLWDDLEDGGYDVTIDVKPKKSTDDEDQDIETQLSVYPDGTEVEFTLK